MFPVAKAVIHLGSTEIIDTFAEAFRLRFARLVVTAHDTSWLEAGVQSFGGYATSVIGCDAEVGVERFISPDESPDGRPGASILAFAFTTDSLAEAVANRTGQCLLTCPTTAVFNGLSQSEEQIPLGQRIRFFGDGFEKTKVFDERRYWRVPVMDGEFLVEENCGVAKGVGGGNVVIQGTSLEATLASAKRAVSAIAAVPGVITPFPGGVVRSGSKVGSRYAALKASTNDAFCPSLLGRVPTQLHPGVVACLEIVIDGENEQVIREAMAAAIQAAAGEDIPAISAGNYGGKLGKFHFNLHQILSDAGLA